MIACDMDEHMRMTYSVVVAPVRVLHAGQDMGL